MVSIAENNSKMLQKSLHLSCVPKKNSFLLKLSLSQNESGIIYRVTAVLFAHGWNILEAIAETSHDGYVHDIFEISPINNQTLTEQGLKEIRNDLNLLFFQDYGVLPYLEKKGINIENLNKASDPSGVVKIYNPLSSDFTVMDVRTKDRPGILFQITRVLHYFGIDIVSFSACSENGIVRDSFLLRSQEGNKLEEGVVLAKLKNSIESIL